MTTNHQTPVDTAAKPDILRRLAYIEGHVQGVKRMVEDDKYCVDVLRQTLAIRKAIQKLEALMLEGHLKECVLAGVREGREDQVVSELIELYRLAES